MHLISIIFLTLQQSIQIKMKMLSNI